MIRLHFLREKVTTYQRMGFTLLLLIFCMPIFLNAQKIRFYNTEQGLPNSFIHRVSQDDRGYIWIATDNGASYFDGMRFTTFHHENSKAGTIISDLVKVVFTDCKGVTWIGATNGLQIFDQSNNAFRDFPIQFNFVPVNPYVSSIIESNDHGKIVVSIAGFGLVVLDRDTHQVDSLTTAQLIQVYNNRFLGNQYFDSKGNLWTFSEQGNFFSLNFKSKFLNQITWSKDLAELSKNIVVSAVAEDPVTKNIIIGTHNHGIFIYDQKLGFIRKPRGASSVQYRIRTLLAETKKEGKHKPLIWVGSEDSGLKQFNLTTEEIIQPNFQYAPIDLENCKVHSIIEDAQGNIWAGIFQKGLLFIPRSSNNFEYIKLTDSPSSTSVNIACVTAINQDKKGNLWVGTDGGGLFKIEKNGTKTRYTTQNTPLQNNAILSLATDKRGTLWISTYMGGITTYNEQTGFRQYSNDVELQKVNCSLYDSISDKLYFGTLGHGVKTINLLTNSITIFPNPDANGWISSLFLDKQSNLWIGHTGSIRCYNTQDGLERHSDLINKIRDIPITTAMVDKDEDIWFGSNIGVYLKRKDSDSLLNFTKKEGLPGNIVVSLLQDPQGKIWLSTLSGLSQYDKATKTFTNFYVYDGLQDNEFRAGAKFIDSSGKIYFGGINGITAFYTNKIINNEKLTSKLYFSRLTVLNHDINFDETLGKKNVIDKHISQATQMTLKNKQNVFSLEFTVLEYANPQKVVYAYMLKGFDKDWRLTNSNRRLATYTNLPAGLYVFHVKAYYEGWSNEKNAVYNSIAIRILPPWYKTWWAYLIYLSLTMLAVWEMMNLLIGRKIRAQEHLELEKKEMRIRMFTDISHEIRTPFTLIISPLKSMLESEADPNRKEMFNLMYRNALRILRLLNQLMDIRKIDNHQFKLQFQKTDLILFVQDVMKSFEQLAIVRNIEFRLITQHETLEVWIDQANFDKVLFNLLSNAFKFTPDNGYITISLATVKNNPDIGLKLNAEEVVELCVENSGSQINESETEQIFERFFQSSNNKTAGGTGVGLHLTKKIVDLHFGHIKAKNTENSVLFTLHIPLGNKHLSSQRISENQENRNINAQVQQDEYLPQTTGFIEQIQNSDETKANSKDRKSKRSLVVVDDDADLGQYIRMELGAKYNIEFYTSAKEAWKIISTTIPDAVMTDLMMPEVDGIALCKKIRQNPETIHLPIIILTAQTDEVSEQLCIESGADHYLTKPINLELLKITIAHAIQTRDMLKNKYKSNITPDFEDIIITSHESKLIAKVVESIRNNIENPEFNIDDLSREVGISRGHLNRKLKENINISPSNLIKSIRLKQAAYLLINNKVNISDVAYKVGFSSHSYFSNNFKEYFGMAPTEFVNKYTGLEDKESLNKLFNV